MAILTQEFLAEKSNSIGVYDVNLYVYGIKSLKKKIRVKIGFGSINHWETVQELVAKEWGTSGTIVNVTSVKPSKKAFGVGKAQSRRDR